jgi:MscS family membrane protein
MEKLDKFWAIVIDVWNNGFMEINIGIYLLAILIFLVFILLRRLFTKFVMNRIEAVTKKTKSDIDDNAFAAIENPIRFIPVVLGTFFAIELLPITGQTEIIANNIIRSLVVYVLFWGVVNLFEPFSFLLKKLEKIFTGPMIDGLVKAIKALFIFIGAATILEIWGIKIGPIIAGLGLVGVAVALGAQDLFKNLISGILVIIEKRFSPGDWIRVDGIVEGIVEKIGFRSTLIRRFDKAPVIVPNSKLSDNPVINFSSMSHRRIYWLLGVEYATSVEQLRQIRDGIEKYILENNDFAKPDEVPTFVRIDRFSDSSIDIMVYCFTKTTKWGEWLKIKESLAYKIKEIVEDAGSSFAYPSSSIYIESFPTEQPEFFIPPGPDSD